MLKGGPNNKENKRNLPSIGPHSAVENRRPLNDDRQQLEGKRRRLEGNRKRLQDNGWRSVTRAVSPSLQEKKANLWASLGTSFDSTQHFHQHGTTDEHNTSISMALLMRQHLSYRCNQLQWHSSSHGTCLLW